MGPASGVAAIRSRIVAVGTVVVGTAAAGIVVADTAAVDIAADIVAAGRAAFVGAVSAVEVVAVDSL
jgi:hypothetical protein